MELLGPGSKIGNITLGDPIPTERGGVFQGKSDTGVDVIVKTSINAVREPQAVRMEAWVLSSTNLYWRNKFGERTPGIVPLYGFWEHGNEATLATEFVPHDESLATAELTTAESLSVTCDAADILSLVHRANFRINDPNLTNWLLHRSQVPTVTFLDAEHAVPRHERTVNMGRRRYMSPDKLLRHPNDDRRIDSWVLGVNLAVLVSGRFPYEVPHIGADQKATRNAVHAMLTQEPWHYNAEVQASVDPLVRRIVYDSTRCPPDVRLSLKDIGDRCAAAFQYFTGKVKPRIV